MNNLITAVPNSGQKCRLCLIKPLVAHKIDAPIIQMVQALTSIQIISDEKIFNVICVKCSLNLRLACKIQKNFETADNKLRQQQIEEKTESPSIEADVDLMLTDHFVNKTENEDEEAEEEDYHSPIDDPIEHNESEFDGNEDFIKTELDVDEDNILLKDPKDDSSIEKNINLTNHIEKKRREYKCEFCEKIFYVKDQFTKHNYYHRQKDRKVECKICKAQITTSNLNKHLEIHYGQPCICEVCGNELKNAEALRTHRHYVHGVEQKCPLCDKKYKKKYSLKKHLAIEHSQGEKTHVCELCGKSFYQQYQLNMHTKRTHEKLRAFSCQYCPKTFSTRQAKRTHERQHTNETPYKCEVCGEGFRQNVSLRAHRKSAHNIIEELTCSCPICGKLFPSQWAVNSHTYKMH